MAFLHLTRSFSKSLSKSAFHCLRTLSPRVVIQQTTSTLMLSSLRPTSVLGSLHSRGFSTENPLCTEKSLQKETLSAVWVRKDVSQLLLQYLEQSDLQMLSQALLTLTIQGATVHCIVGFASMGLKFLYERRNPGAVSVKTLTDEEKLERINKFLKSFQAKEMLGYWANPIIDILMVFCASSEYFYPIAFVLLGCKNSYMWLMYKDYQTVRSPEVIDMMLEEMGAYLKEKNGSKNFKVVLEELAVHVELLPIMQGKPIVSVLGSLLFVNGTKKDEGPCELRCRIPMLRYDGSGAKAVLTGRGTLHVLLPLLQEVGKQNLVFDVGVYEKVS